MAIFPHALTSFSALQPEADGDLTYRLVRRRVALGVAPSGADTSIMVVAYLQGTDEDEVRSLSADVSLPGHGDGAGKPAAGLRPEGGGARLRFALGDRPHRHRAPVLRGELARLADDALTRRGDHRAGAARHVRPDPAGAPPGGARQGDRDPP